MKDNDDLYSPDAVALVLDPINVDEDGDWDGTVELIMLTNAEGGWLDDENKGILVRTAKLLAAAMYGMAQDDELLTKLEGLLEENIVPAMKLITRDTELTESTPTGGNA